MSNLDRTVDLFSLQFWSIVVLALAVLTPLTSPRARAAALAAINLLMIALLLRADVAQVLIGVLAAWVGLKWLGGRAGPVAAGLGVAAILALFLIHKRPDLAARLGAAPLNPILAAVGFSYAALRLYELGRAVREGRHAPPGLLAMVNYLLPFHMLAAGPIQAYDDFVAQPAVPPAPTTRDALEGFERIASGLFKKYVLAYVIERVFLTDFRAQGPYFFAEVQLNFLWLYLDFSAYSDIAAGIGRLLGVATPENFNRPYLARNVIEFWERWHISLSLFIRRNLFIPIQVALMRRSDGRRPLLIASIAFTISFLLCGLWHEVSWVYLAWGGYHAAGLIACNIYKHALLRRLGRKGLNRYMAIPWVRALGVAATYEFAAFSLVLLKFPAWLNPWVRGY